VRPGESRDDGLRRCGDGTRQRACALVRNGYALIVCNSSMLSPFCHLLDKLLGIEIDADRVFVVAERLRM